MSSFSAGGEMPLSPCPGSPAEKVLSDRFFVRLLGLVRKRLFAQIRSDKDVLVLDSVLSSFFKHHATEDIDLDDEDSLWPMLARVALRHCNKHNKRAQRAPNVSALGVDPTADEPSPEDEVEFLEFLTRFQTRLSEREKKVLELALDQEAQGDIARKLAVSQTTISNDMKRLRTKLEAELTLD